MLKDVLDRPVDTGDEVILLCKERNYRGLKDAYLGHAIYLGEGQWGHEFIDYDKRDDEDPSPYRVKNPECVRVDREEGVPYVQA